MPRVGFERAIAADAEALVAIRVAGTAVLADVLARADASRLPVRVGALRGRDANRFYLRHGFELRDEGEWDNHYLRPARLADDRDLATG